MSEKIPIISLWQPWAQWIALGWKLIESRRHNRFKSLEGKRIGIHASAKWDAGWSMQAGRFLPHERRMQTFDFMRVNPPGILCTVMVSSYGVLSPNDAKWALIECETPRMGLWLRDVQLLEPIVRCNGKQGIWYHDLSLPLLRP